MWLAAWGPDWGPGWSGGGGEGGGVPLHCVGLVPPFVWRGRGVHWGHVGHGL